MCPSIPIFVLPVVLFFLEHLCGAVDNLGIGHARLVDVDLEKGLCEARSVNEVGSDEEEIGD